MTHERIRIEQDAVIAAARRQVAEQRLVTSDYLMDETGFSAAHLKGRLKGLRRQGRFPWALTRTDRPLPRYGAITEGAAAMLESLRRNPPDPAMASARIHGESIPSPAPPATEAELRGWVREARRIARRLGIGPKRQRKACAA